MQRAVIDTNVFIAAGFNPGSASASILDLIRSGHLIAVWNEATRRETRALLERIPRLDWNHAVPLFQDEGRYDLETDTGLVDFVTDPEDRKFAALSLASGAPIVSSDDHLLAHRDRLTVWTLGAFIRERLDQES